MTESMVSRKTAASGVSPKVTAASFAAAITTIFWTIAAATFWKKTFSDSSLAALTGASATVLAYAGSYITRDPLREEGSV